MYNDFADLTIIGGFHLKTKKPVFFAIILAFAILLAACANRPAPDISTAPAQQAEPEPPEKPVPESPATEKPKDGFEIFKSLEEQARAVYFWYNGTTAEGNEYGLEIDEAEIPYGAEYLTDEQRYRKVGKFGAVDEMMAASEEVFTKEFCESFFYESAFEGDSPLYPVRDGVLCRDTMAGGTGYYTDTVLGHYIQHKDDETIVIKAQKTAYGTDTEICDIILKNIGGKWKIDTYFDMNPHKKTSGAFNIPNELVVGNAVSSGLCTLDWRDANKIDAEKLLHFYMYSYLFNTEDLDYDFGWRVSSAKLMEGLSAHLSGIRPEAFDAVRENLYTSVFYDDATDSFSIDNYAAPVDYVVLGSEKAGNATTLEIMVFDTAPVDFNIENGPVLQESAAYTAFLAVEVNGESVKILGNRFGEDFRPRP